LVGQEGGVTASLPVRALEALGLNGNSMQLNSPIDIEARQAEAMKIMTDAKKLLEQTGLEVSLITRCPNGARWPVLMLEVGETYRDIEAARKGN